METIGRFTDWPYGNRPIHPFDFQLVQETTDAFRSGTHRRTRGHFTSGGEFLVKKRVVTFEPSDPLIVTWGHGDNVLYQGKMVGIEPNTPQYAEAANLIGYGPEVLRIADPQQSLMEGLNAIYELKDLGEMLSVKAYELNQLSDLGNLHLGLNFAWAPFISDLQALDKAQSEMEKRIDQLLRDAGRPVRRKFDLDHYKIEEEEVVATGVTDYPQAFPVFVSQAYSGQCTWKLIKTRNQRLWFSGQARYDLPSKVGFSTEQYRAKMRRRLYGLAVTPKRLYKAIPWTWLLDWVGNVSDNLNSLVPAVADRLVWNYAYIMRTLEDSYVFEQSFHMWGPEGLQPVTLRTRASSVRKERVYAWPYAAQLRPSVSPFQASIIGALGVSKMRGSAASHMV